MSFSNESNELSKKILKSALQAKRFIGPGIDRIRKSEGIIRRLSEDTLLKNTISRKIKFRPYLSENKKKEKVRNYEPAIIHSEAHLKSKRISHHLYGTHYFKLQWITKQLKEENKTMQKLNEIIEKGNEINLEQKVKMELTQKKINRLQAMLPIQSVNTAYDQFRNLSKNSRINESIPEIIEKTLLTENNPKSILKNSNLIINKSDYHDFSSYVYVKEPRFAESLEGGAGIEPELEQFLLEASITIHDIVLTYQPVDAIEKGDYLPVKYVPVYSDLEKDICKLFLTYAAGSLYILRCRIEKAEGNEVLAAFSEWLKALIIDLPFNKSSIINSCDNPEIWKQCAVQVEEILRKMHPEIQISNYIGGTEGSYSFVPFDTNFVNFGLKIVYRQEWKHLGTQPGEIVKTIPLGPKQTEKVTTKIISTNKITKSAEEATSSETSNESANTTKDSSDIIREASNNFKWHTEAEAGAKFGKIISAKVSGGMSGESATSSKDSKAHLNEAIEKTASKLRRDNKVIVTTEVSTSDEYSTTSEITNPNDDIAVTYIYSKLQRQYEITTTMAEVNSVVFVPEKVPYPYEINEEWIRNHAWILSKALLDNSFDDVLSTIVNEVEEPNLDMEDIKHFKEISSKVKEDLASFNLLPGSLPDIFIGPQENYKEQIDKVRSINAKNQRLKQQKERFIFHIQQNILHYMKAIWSAENPDQRLMRYSRIKVPVCWSFSGDIHSTKKKPSGKIAGDFVPNMNAWSMKPLTEIINPAGPIGFVGNYAIFYYKSTKELHYLNEALSLLREDYVKFEVTADSTENIYDTFAFEPLYSKAKYNILFTKAEGWKISSDIGGVVNNDEIKIVGNSIEFDGIRVTFNKLPKKDFEVNIYLTGTDELLDPEEKMLKLLKPLPGIEHEADFFSQSLLADMATYFEALQELNDFKDILSWEALDNNVKKFIRKNYHKYLLVKEHTTRFLLDTNNLMLDLEIGATPSLEYYKKFHRAIDVMKELEEYNRRKLENQRRSKLIENDIFDDPEIENMTVVKVPEAPDRVDAVNVIIPKSDDAAKNEDAVK